MRKRYEIEKDIVLIDDILEKDPAAAVKFLEELGGEAEEKLAAYFHVIKGKEASLIEAKAVVETAQKFIARRTKEIEFLENGIKSTMLLLKLKKIDRPDARITIVEGREVLRRTTDLASIPAPFKTEEPQPPKIIIDWKKVEADVKAAQAEAEEIAKIEGAPFNPETFSFYGCRITRGEPSLRYPKLNAGTTGKEE